MQDIPRRIGKLASETKIRRHFKPVKQTILVGIIGTGGIANGKHMPSLAKVEGVEMVAFCDIDENKAQVAAAKYGTSDAKVYTDYTSF